MFKKFSIVLLVLLMWVSVGYGGNYYGDYFVAKEFGNKGNSSGQDMSIETPSPQGQSNKNCAGPFDYEILNREPIDVQPTIRLKSHKNFYDYTIDDFEITGIDNIKKIDSPLELAI